MGKYSLETLMRTEAASDSRCRATSSISPSAAASSRSVRQPRPIRYRATSWRSRDHVLRRSGFVIDVAGVGIVAAIEQKGRDIDGRREMQWRLPIAPARVDQFRIGIDQLAEPLEHAQASRRMSIDRGAARDQKLRKFRVCAVEDAETACPPVAPRIDIGPGAQQHIHDLAIALPHREEQRRRAEVEFRIALIEMRPNVGMLFEDRRHPGRVVRSNRPEEGLHGVFHV